MSAIDILNPLEVAGWDGMILDFPGCTPFHSAAWARLLTESYGYMPQYVAVKTGARFLAVLPLMEIRSFLTGRRGVSLPFSDRCSILSHNSVHLGAIIDAAMSMGKRRRWSYLDLRGLELPQKPFRRFYFHQLDLRPGHQKLFSRLKSSHKRNIKKAANEGVTSAFFRSLASVRSFYHLNCMTRRKHGLPPQPFRFFRKLHEHVISRGMGLVALAMYRGMPIAGGIFLNLGKMAVYKFGASDPAWLHLRPNNLVMWESIQWYARNDFESLDFGRTDMGHDGLLRFKEGWGSRRTILRYHRFDMATSGFVSSNKPSGKSLRLMEKIPLSVLRLIGRALYRHIG